jgi:hypothetical protein
MIMANALLVEGSNSEYKQPGASPAGLGEPLARHHRPHYVHRQPLRGRPSADGRAAIGELHADREVLRLSELWASRALSQYISPAARHPAWGSADVA